MKTYKPDWDLSSIPDELIISRYKSIISRRRQLIDVDPAKREFLNKQRKRQEEYRNRLKSKANEINDLANSTE